MHRKSGLQTALPIRLVHCLSDVDHLWIIKIDGFMLCHATNAILNIKGKQANNWRFELINIRMQLDWDTQIMRCLSTSETRIMLLTGTLVGSYINEVCSLID